MNRVVAVVLVGAVLVFGVRVLLGWGQRYNCGAPAGGAFLLSVQALGAVPSATDCLALAVTAHARPASPPATTPPATTEPEPPGWLDPDAKPTSRQQALERCTEGLAEAPARKDLERCMADLGFPGPVPELEQWRREGP
jgi:hypothetical protein